MRRLLIVLALVCVPALAQAQIDITMGPTPARSRYTLTTDIPGGSASSNAAPYSISAITGGTVTLSSTSDHPGVITLTSAAGASSGYAVWSAQVNGLSLGGHEHFEVILRPQKFAGTVNTWGFLDTITAAAIVDGVHLNIDTNGLLSGIAVSNSTPTATATTYQLVLNTWYRLTVDINADATGATFAAYSMAGAGLWTDTVASNVPTGVGRETGIGGLALYTPGGVNALVDVDFIHFDIGRALVR